MDHDELFNMLDLGSAPKQVKVKSGNAAKPEKRPVEAKQEPTVFKLDEWDIEKGMRLGRKHGEKFAGQLSDFFAAAYKPEPEMHEFCVDTRRQEFLKTILDSTEYKALRESTYLNELHSELAAADFNEKFQKLIEKDKKVPDGKKKEQKLHSLLMSAVSEALEAATDDVEEAEMTARGLGGCGGIDGQSMNPADVAALYQRVRNNAQLRRIVELAGKFRMMAQSKQRQKFVHGYDDMIGVELGGDVSRLLPLEMAKLAVPEFKLDVMRRLVERQMMCREYRSVENEMKGLIIVTVDESGSMGGEPVCHAKAFALAMAWIASHQNRWCGLVGYSGGCAGNLLVLPPKKWNQSALCDWLSHFYSGGTDRDVPIVELPEFYDRLKAPKGKTDLIMITDAVCHLRDYEVKKFQDWKQRAKVRAISLVTSYRAGDLEKVSDEVHYVSEINTTTEAVGECLSI